MMMVKKSNWNEKCQKMIRHQKLGLTFLQSLDSLAVGASLMLVWVVKSTWHSELLTAQTSPEMVEIEIQSTKTKYTSRKLYFNSIHNGGNEQEKHSFLSM